MPNKTKLEEIAHDAAYDEAFPHGEPKRTVPRDRFKVQLEFTVSVELTYEGEYLAAKVYGRDSALAIARQIERVNPPAQVIITKIEPRKA